MLDAPADGRTPRGHRGERPGACARLRGLPGGSRRAAKASFMKTNHSVVSVLDDHTAAEAVVQRLIDAGFEKTHLSIVGKGFHTEETIAGFYNMGDRVKFWGARGAFWGGLWGLFFGGVFLATPFVGPVIVLGYLATALIAAVEGAVLGAGITALAAALYSVGIPKNSVLAYEAVLKSNGFLVMAHGTPEEMARAKAIMQVGNARKIDMHEGGAKPLPVILG